MELTECPECGHAAEIEWRERVPEGAEDVALVKLRCVQQHWFLMPSGRVLTFRHDGRVRRVA